MAKSGSRLFFFLALIGSYLSLYLVTFIIMTVFLSGVWWCCASIDFSEDWSINMKSTVSYTVELTQYR